ALERSAATPYGLIFMDCQMPDMDGFEAVRRIRRREAADPVARTPIVAMTGNVMPGDRERCLEAGMDGYLAKPIDLELLCAAVERWLSVEAGDAAQPPSAAGAEDAGASATPVVAQASAIADAAGALPAF